MDTPTWTDPYSPEAVQEITANVLTGENYRIFYESATKRKLIETYKNLRDLANRHPDNESDWRNSIKEILENNSQESKILQLWLIGLTKKTADNLGVTRKDYPVLFDDMMKCFERTEKSCKDRREMALLFWCGTATLTIRGSAKSKYGKALERSLAKSALTIIGLDEQKGDFRLNVEGDKEVVRETDAEIRTKRGWVRMEIGLIGRGNSEVISDKVGRVGRNGIIMMDVMPKQSTAYLTASNSGVHLIQLRNNQPVEELRQYLSGLDVPVQKESIETAEVKNRVMEMPLETFTRIKK